MKNIDNDEVRDALADLEEMEKLEETIKIEFYITKSDELSKIEINMNDYLKESDDVSEFILGMEFRDLNNTKVEIPSEATSSITDLETYIKTFATLGTDDDLNNDYDFDYDSSLDSDFGNMGFEF